MRGMSRILFFSDSHGSFPAMKALRARVEADAPDLVCFLGDALYHGPRNGLPVDYDTKRAADEFNAMAERIVATGHTHVPIVERVNSRWCFNPGSISIPKGGSEPSYALLEDKLLTLRRLADGAVSRVANLT